MQDSQLNFTSPIRGLQLRSNVRVSKPIINSGRMTIRRSHAQAIWDTGASTSSISRKLATLLELEVVERTVLITGAGPMGAFQDVVLVDVLLDDTVIPVKAAIIDNIPGSGNDFLIGMDVIQYGTLTIDSDFAAGTFNVSFKPYPETFETVKELFRKCR